MHGRGYGLAGDDALARSRCRISGRGATLNVGETLVAGDGLRSREVGRIGQQRQLAVEEFSSCDSIVAVSLRRGLPLGEGSDRLLDRPYELLVDGAWNDGSHRRC